MFEVELKAIVRNRSATITQIENLCNETALNLVYDDVYLDKENTLTTVDKELRLRNKTNRDSGESRFFLTFKDSPFDEKSKSKPEFETEIADFNTGIAIFQKLGYSISMRYTKECLIYNLTYQDIKLEVSIVKLPELENTFIEVETQTETEKDIKSRFKILHEFLNQIGIAQIDITSQYYVDAIKEKREQDQRLD
ncbi:class IV adenylate cyclase [Leeuwenhoekiella sp. A16]|uniref:class IV adenylate cyclase n=1 Tax=unclassified Leeuwenhoekiella TaxID=2615029 RepID=UPI003A80B4C4